MTGLSWAQLVDVGLVHAERMGDAEGQHVHWVLVASDGSALVEVSGGSGAWVVNVYRPGPRPPGATSSMRDWIHDWHRVYTDVAELVADVAAIAG